MASNERITGKQKTKSSSLRKAKKTKQGIIEIAK